MKKLSESTTFSLCVLDVKTTFMVSKASLEPPQLNAILVPVEKSGLFSSFTLIMVFKLYSFSL